jgi:hypothetical protein
VLGHAPVPERWVARSHWATVLFSPPPPLFDSDVRRFQQARGNELTLTENSMKQSGRTRRRALRVYVSGKESDGVRWVASCSWRLCQVTSSSGPPTALFTYTYSAHGQPRVQKKCFWPIPNPWGLRTRNIRRLMVYFNTCVKTRRISKNRIWHGRQV